MKHSDKFSHNNKDYEGNVPQQDEIDPEAIETFNDIVQAPEFWENSDELLDIYILVKGAAFDGTPYWAYMRVPPSKMNPFKAAIMAGHNNLLDYGFILSIGYSENPPQDIQQEMEQEYGLSHRFEEELQEEILNAYEKIKLKEYAKSGALMKSDYLERRDHFKQKLDEIRKKLREKKND